MTIILIIVGKVVTIRELLENAVTIISIIVGKVVTIRVGLPLEQR